MKKCCFYVSSRACVALDQLHESYGYSRSVMVSAAVCLLESCLDLGDEEAKQLISDTALAMFSERKSK